MSLMLKVRAHQYIDAGESAVALYLLGLKGTSVHPVYPIDQIGWSDLWNNSGGIDVIETIRVEIILRSGAEDMFPERTVDFLVCLNDSVDYTKMRGVSLSDSEITFYGPEYVGNYHCKCVPTVVRAHRRTERNVYTLEPTQIVHYSVPSDGPEADVSTQS